MKLKSIIGKTIVEVIDRHEGDNEGDSIDLLLSDESILTVFVNRQPSGCSDLGISYDLISAVDGRKIP